MSRLVKVSAGVNRIFQRDYSKFMQEKVRSVFLSNISSGASRNSAKVGEIGQMFLRVEWDWSNIAKAGKIGQNCSGNRQDCSNFPQGVG